MSPHNLQELIGALNPVCQRAMEAAAALCVARTHATVDLTHLVLKLLDEPNTDTQRILRWFGVNAGEAASQLTASMERLPSGFEGTPSLSAHVIDALRGAVMLTTRFTHDDHARSSSILLAIVGHGPLRTELLIRATEFARIPPTALAHGLTEVTRGSCEDTRAPSNTPRSSSQTEPKGNALSLYTHDLNAKAQAGTLDPVVGRDNDVELMINVLMRRRQNNPILVGPPGVGKTAIVEGLALQIHAGQVPEALLGVCIRTLDLGLLQAGAGIQGELEKRLYQILEGVKTAPTPVILFIDEAHMLVGSSTTGGRRETANLLKPALARGDLRTIAATTWSEYKKHFEKDAALARRFQPIQIHEPEDNVAIDMLGALVEALETHHGVVIEEEALSQAVHLSRRYIPSRCLPDKAISVLDTACAYVAMLAAPHTQNRVNAQSIAKVISDWTGIPVGRMLRDEIALILNLKTQLAARIVGQDEALDTLSRRIQTSRAGLDDPNKPVGIFLLAGPSGVGKTETAWALSDLLYGGSQNLITINMSEYQEPHSVALLRGSPPGYVGYGQGGILTEAVRRRPYSVVLLDEIEKAHRDVLEVFYQVFDKGTLEDAEGVSVDFRNTVILLTSNVGGHLSPHHEPDDEALWMSLRRSFPDAFLGRLITVPYRRLTTENLEDITKLKLATISTRFESRHGASAKFADDTPARIARRCSLSSTGARDIDRLLSHHLLPAMAGAVLERASRGKAPVDLFIVLDEGGQFRCQ